MMGFIISLLISLLIACAVFLCPLWYITLRKKKLERGGVTKGQNQYLMFNELKKGDYVWEIMPDDTVASCKVDTVEYEFNYKHELKSVEIELIHPWFPSIGKSIIIPAKDAKSYEYHSYYTLYKDAKVRNDAIKKKKESEITNFKTVTESDINNAIDDVIESLKNFEEKLKIKKS